MQEITRILAWIAENRVAYAEITLTVKGGKVAFIDYRGPLRGGDPEERCPENEE